MSQYETIIIRRDLLEAMVSKKVAVLIHDKVADRKYYTLHPDRRHELSGVGNRQWKFEQEENTKSINDASLELERESNSGSFMDEVVRYNQKRSK